LAKNNHAVNGGGADPKGNKLELNKKKPKNIIVGKVPRQFAATANIGTGDGGRHDDTERLDDISNELAKQLTLQFEELQGVIFGRMVQKVGDRRYWEQWAKSVAEIAARFVDRINRLIETDGEHKKAFDEFLSGLQKNINPSISTQDAVEMLSQHVITKPVFEALFEGYSFVKNNAISVSMQNMLDLLGSDRLDPKHGGVICFVSNGAWLDTNAMDGFRKCLEKDFSSIYVFNLRGNCRTSGELRQKEAGNVFGLGSRTPIAITILVKKGE
jgi:predicted helicase